MLKHRSAKPTAKRLKSSKSPRLKSSKSIATRPKTIPQKRRVSSRGFFFTREEGAYADDSPTHAPSSGRLTRETSKLSKNIKLYLEARDATDIVNYITSDEFLGLKEMIKIADSQAVRSQASEVVIPVPVLQRWVRDRLKEDPENIYYRIILESIPHTFPNLDGASLDGGSDDDQLVQIMRQSSLHRLNENPGAEWILRRNFWKLEGLSNSSVLPIEWAEFLGCIANRIPMQNPESLTTMATYFKFCGIPFELHNAIENDTVSTRGNDCDTEVVSDIVEHIIAASPVLLEALEESSHPDSNTSILSATWFQGLMSMAVMVPAFEARLNEYQQKQVGSSHIPFATILKKHHGLTGVPINRPSTYFNAQKEMNASTRKFYEAQIIDVGQEAFADPFSPQRKYSHFLGGRNLAALSSHLQLDDMYMLTAVCGEILHKFNGVESKLALDDSVNFNELANNRGGAGNANDFKSFLAKSIENSQLELEDKLKREAKLKSAQDRYLGKKAASLDRSEAGKGEDPSTSELTSDEDDHADLIGQTVYIPEIAQSFVNPVDDSQNFIGHFDSEDINEFLHDPTIIRALGSIKNNHLKDVINYKVLRSKNWMKLDLREVDKIDSIDVDERFGPVDSSPFLLKDLPGVFPHMLQQTDDIISSHTVNFKNPNL